MSANLLVLESTQKIYTNICNFVTHLLCCAECKDPLMQIFSNSSQLRKAKKTTTAKPKNLQHARATASEITAKQGKGGKEVVYITNNYHHAKTKTNTASFATEKRIH